MLNLCAFFANTIEEVSGLCRPFLIFECVGLLIFVFLAEFGFEFPIGSRLFLLYLSIPLPSALTVSFGGLFASTTNFI